MPENFIPERAMRWQLVPITEQPTQSRALLNRHLNVNDIPL